jgi:hypothetical protein
LPAAHLAAIAYRDPLAHQAYVVLVVVKVAINARRIVLYAGA